MAKRAKEKPSKIEETTSSTLPQLAITHFKIGWIGILVFLSLGIVLELLHGTKASLYLDVRNETRRLMWTLAHAHGTLLSLIHIGYAATLVTIPALACRKLTSKLLMAGLVLLPTGFLVGGIWIHGGDPGIGILLVPAGAIFLLIGVATICWTVLRIC